jgi:ABC-2 type transport system ATP-binding protein
LSQFGLAHKAKNYVTKLSGGERQKLSVLLALIPRPKLLMLDELTAGLDPEARRSLWNSLKEIKASGVSILLISHFMDEVNYLADRLLFMKDGRARFIGTKEALHSYAKDALAGAYREDMTLEDVYLALARDAASDGKEILQ